MDLKEALGATEAATADRFAIYLPDRDSEGEPIEIDAWIETALTIMTEINGGSTRLAPSIGMYNNNGKIIRENTTVVYSFIRDADNFIANLPRIKKFLHTFGYETRQQEVMVEFSGESSGSFFQRAYMISDYQRVTE